MDFTNWLVDETDSDSVHFIFGGIFGSIRTSDGKWDKKSGNYDRPYICKTAKGKIQILNSIRFFFFLCNNDEIR